MTTRKNPKPLKILLVGNQDWSQVAELSTKGHEVIVDAEGLDHYDLILGPTCCRFLPGMEKFLDAIIKGARKVRYPAKEKP